MKFTNGEEVDLVQHLVVAIEQRQVTWPREWAVLTDEPKRYEYEISPAGVGWGLMYSAPSGFHDDAVTALELTASRLYPTQSGGTIVSLGPARTSASPRVSRRS